MAIARYLPSVMDGKKKKKNINKKNKQLKIVHV